MKEETFGPIMGIMKVSSDEEAIELMNDSEFGLTGSIWSQDLDGKVNELADRIDAGTVFINRYPPRSSPTPAPEWRFHTTHMFPSCCSCQTRGCVILLRASVDFVNIN